ncbi:ABC transporter ATP-binding protein, putative [Babesia caballi]|uniref:ABC transporter ATP-binding protein, putative n=1 Tax=Babesia caballi TaxID=5871 RepID=A0AAV4LUU4_BABCB|nr:ABC transporter ATP-binding protein, putative [Babesia caballi]
MTDSTDIVSPIPTVVSTSDSGSSFLLLRDFLCRRTPHIRDGLIRRVQGRRARSLESAEAPPAYTLGYTDEAVAQLVEADDAILRQAGVFGDGDERVAVEALAEAGGEGVHVDAPVAEGLQPGVHLRDQDGVDGLVVLVHGRYELGRVRKLSQRNRAAERSVDGEKQRIHLAIHVPFGFEYAERHERAVQGRPLAEFHHVPQRLRLDDGGAELEHLLPEPVVVERLVRGGAPSAVPVEEVRYEVLRLAGDPAPPGALELEHPLLYLPQNLLVPLPVEGRRPREEHVDDHAGAPHVALLVVAPVDHLGVHVVDRPVHLAHRHAVLEEPGEAEVDHLQQGARVRGGKDPVFELEVAVADAVRVEVVDREQHLHRQPLRVALGEALVVVQPVVELPARAVLHDEVADAGGVVGLVEKRDVGVVELGENRDFVEGAHELAPRKRARPQAL